MRTEPFVSKLGHLSPSIPFNENHVAFSFYRSGQRVRDTGRQKPSLTARQWSWPFASVLGTVPSDLMTINWHQKKCDTQTHSYLRLKSGMTESLLISQLLCPTMSLFNAFDKSKGFSVECFNCDSGSRLHFGPKLLSD